MTGGVGEWLWDLLRGVLLSTLPWLRKFRSRLALGLPENASMHTHTSLRLLVKALGSPQLAKIYKRATLSSSVIAKTLHRAGFAKALQTFDARLLQKRSMASSDSPSELHSFVV